MRMKIVFIVFVTMVLLALFASMYLFNIYEVMIEVSPKELFADSQSEVIIEAYPVNAFGWKIPFRSVKTNFEIVEGREFVSIKLMDSENGKLILTAKDLSGIVTILVRPSKSILPSEIKIPILKNIT